MWSGLMVPWPRLEISLWAEDLGILSEFTQEPNKVELSKEKFNSDAVIFVEIIFLHKPRQSIKKTSTERNLKS